MRSAIALTVECPVCERTMHVRYWPDLGPDDPADWDIAPHDEPCPCYDSGLLREADYLRELGRRMHDEWRAA